MTLISVDQSNFEERVLSANMPVVVLFCTKGKKSSDSMIASLEKAAQAQAGKILFLEKAFDPEGEVERNYDVQSAPTTLMLDKSGDLVRTVVGFYNYADLFKTWVDGLAAPDA
ncbi:MULTISPECIES: co-chaperone YbbN [unclassified Pseudomonas]|uniref:thioredoxin family protein n=1 Tax=unclassified Pseudomonas TaxID=196821 RepID=UPI000538DF00|nr:MULTISPECIES: thioredoxin domain-containing protein [unclassified Pseudomonas]MBD0685148.1 hypothetical protein [Pseudomonas sp. PSB18]CDF94799.1 hypothetical protein BN844_5002 [Pseudomonas sp. SHC52]